MSDSNDKIINFHKRAQNTPKGAKEKVFPFIKLVKDDNGNFFSEEILREYAQKVSYIVSVMKKNPPSVALYKYKVAQNSLTEFLNNLSDGELVDIEKYIPEDLA